MRYEKPFTLLPPSNGPCLPRPGAERQLQSLPPDFTLTVGGGANYFVPGLSKEWTDYEQGIGLQIGYNPTATLMVKIRDKIGLSLTSGKSFSGIHKQSLPMAWSSTGPTTTSAIFRLFWGLGFTSEKACTWSRASGPTSRR
jgi:hypothetical protein